MAGERVAERVELHVNVEDLGAPERRMVSGARRILLGQVWITWDEEEDHAAMT
jgi:hypothetical protein